MRSEAKRCHNAGYHHGEEEDEEKRAEEANDGWKIDQKKISVEKQQTHGLNS